MTMRKLLIFLAVLLSPVLISAQEQSEKIEMHQVTKVGDNFVLSGFKIGSAKQDFEAILYDKDLKEISRYTKKVIEGIKSYYTGKSGDLTVFTFYGNGTTEKYRIALDAGFKEVFASAPSEAALKAKDTETTKVGAEWTYEPGYCNYYFIGDLMLEAQMNYLTCYSLTDPVQGNYTEKWYKDFSSNGFVKLNLIQIQGRTAYYYAVERLELTQKLIAIDIDKGDILFTTVLDMADTLDVVGISTLYVKDNTIFTGGTYIAHEDNIVFRAQVVEDGHYTERGYDSRTDFYMAEADGFFLMTLDANSGKITNMKTFDFPSVDKTVDMRDYRMAICHGIAPLNNGKMVAFFEFVSCSKSKASGEGPNIGPMSGRGKRMDEDSKETIKWQTDAFTSVVFKPDFSDFDATNFIWDEDSEDYTLADYDIFSLVPNAQMPHDFCTLDDEGCYVQNFVCDGKTWVYNVHSDDTELSDFLIRCNETEIKSTKLLSPGLLLMTGTNKGIQLKDLAGSVKLQVFTW
jgi:hypothetical protein